MQIRLSDCIAQTFYPLHRDIANSLHSEYFLKGGRGSAKSSFASIELILCLLKYPDANAIVYRKVASTLRSSVLEQLLWAINKLQLSHLFSCHLSEMELTYKPTGQRILLRGADDPAKSKSLKLASGVFRFLWFEEASEFSSYHAIRTIKASILRGMGPAVTIYTYNPPERPSNWINQEVLIPRKWRIVHHSTYLDLPHSWLGDSFSLEANALKGINDRAYRHMYLGEVLGTGASVFENVTLREITQSEKDSLSCVCNGLDFGFAADPDAMVHLYYDPRHQRILITNEFFAIRTPIDTLADAILSTIGTSYIHCDSAEPRMIQELRTRGIHAIPAKKGAGSVKSGIRFLQELSEIVIDPDTCPNAAREFSSYEYQQAAHGTFLSDVPDKDNHTIDAVRYALNDIIRMKQAKTIPKRDLGL